MRTRVSGENISLCTFRASRPVEATERASRDLYLDEAIRYAPKLVTLLDTNPYRTTYGCFDREYWHYRTADFPCAMHQASVLPLTLFYQIPHPDNPLHAQPRVREWIDAALEWTRRSSHRDGSGDDYYPFERAAGASAFSLFAVTEAALRLEHSDPALEDFVARRARWLVAHDEPGRISNHLALGALAVHNASRLLDDRSLRESARRKAETLCSWQTSEGWFPEYDGCDPGYHTWTIDFLAKYFQRTRDESLVPTLERAVDFAHAFLHPDGTCGGVYGSRDSVNFFPHGFEILAPRIPAARTIADRFLAALGRGRQARFEDDRVFQHHLEDYLLAYLDHTSLCAGSESEETPTGDFRQVFPEAGLLSERRGDVHLFASLKKGGALRLYRGIECVHSEAGLVGRTANGTVVTSSLLDDEREIRIEPDRVTIRGTFHAASHPYATPLKLVVFRLLLLATGFSPGLSRWTKQLLQRLLVLARTPAPFDHAREIEWQGDRPGLRVRDTIRRRGGDELTSLHVGTDFTSRYTAIGEVWEPTRLEPWTCLEEFLGPLPRLGSTTIERTLIHDTMTDGENP